MTRTGSSLNVALLGVGLVGSEVLKQLGELSRDGGVCPFNLVAVANSSSMILGSSLPFDAASSLKQHGQPWEHQTLTRHLHSLGRSVVVDCTASDVVPRLYADWLRGAVSVVAANKKGFAGPEFLFREIYDAPTGVRAQVYHESSVGAGLPVINTLRDLVKTGDKVRRIEGVLSGTLSFLFNVFSPAAPAPGSVPPKFSEVVRMAKESGFTEPDPRDDLSGMDVARKVTILARVAGLSGVETSHLDVASLVPKQLEDVETACEFMDRLPEHDEEFSRKALEAAERGEVLRYVGFVDMESGECGVKLESYPRTHPFAGLSGSDNIIAFTTDRFPSPLVIRGAGAGAAVTAFGVVSDLFKVLEKW